MALVETTRRSRETFLDGGRELVLDLFYISSGS